jgi:hypothetical protein
MEQKRPGVARPLTVFRSLAIADAAVLNCRGRRQRRMVRHHVIDYLALSAGRAGQALSLAFGHG